jgi:Tol biopolymer transport system component
VYVINADGTGLRRIAEGVQPAWSPDGRRIGYMYGRCCPRTGGIFVVDVDRGTARQLVDWALTRTADSVEPGVENPTWSPDGRSIAFWGGSDQLVDSHIFIVNDDGADLRKLIYGWSPAWSPNSPLLAFLGFAGGISIVGADGSGRSLIAVPGQITGRLSWTPKGGLLFNRDRRVVVWEGGAERQLIPDAQAPAVPGYWDSDAVWSR